MIESSTRISNEIDKVFGTRGLDLRQSVRACLGRFEEQVCLNWAHGLAMEVRAEIGEVVLHRMRFFDTPLRQIFDLVAADVGQSIKEISIIVGPLITTFFPVNFSSGGIYSPTSFEALKSISKPNVKENEQAMEYIFDGKVRVQLMAGAEASGETEQVQDGVVVVFGAVGQAMSAGDISPINFSS